MRIVRAVVARQAIIARWAGNKKTVRATRADNEITKKISSPQPSPKERECSNGKVRQKMNEQKTVRAARADKEKTNNERTNDEQMTNK